MTAPVTSAEIKERVPLLHFWAFVGCYRMNFYPLMQETGWVSGPVWTVVTNRKPVFRAGIRTLDRPVRHPVPAAAVVYFHGVDRGNFMFNFHSV